VDIWDCWKGDSCMNRALLVDAAMLHALLENC